VLPSPSNLQITFQLIFNKDVVLATIQPQFTQFVAFVCSFQKFKIFESNSNSPTTRLTRIHTTLHWLTLWTGPLYYFGWSTWDYYGVRRPNIFALRVQFSYPFFFFFFQTATSDWVGFVVLIPLAVFAVLAIASFIAMSAVNAHEPSGNEVAAVDAMANTEHLTLLNDNSREAYTFLFSY